MSLKTELGLIESEYGPKFTIKFPEIKSGHEMPAAVLDSLRGLNYETTHKTFNPTEKRWEFDLLAFPLILMDVIVSNDLEVTNQEMVHHLSKEAGQILAKRKALADLRIKLEDNWCYLQEVKKKVPAALNNELSYYEEDYERYDSYKKGKWDGKNYFLKKQPGKGNYRFRLGLWPRAKILFKALKFKLEIIDNRKLINKTTKFTTLPAQVLQNLGIDVLWLHQQQALAKCLTETTGIVEIAMGGGKSITMAELIAILKQPANVYIHSLDIGYQLFEVFQIAFGPENVGWIGDSDCKPVMGGINVILLPTARVALEAMGYIEKWKRVDDKWEKVVKKIKIDETRYSTICETIFAANLSIYDEGHHLGAKTYARVSACTRSNYNFCFSATPWRNDGADLELEAGAGPKIVSFGIDELIDMGVLMAPQVQIHEVRTPPIDSKNWRTHYSVGVVKSLERNHRIAELTEELVQTNRTGIVSVEQVQHGKKINKLLKEKGLKSIFLYGNDKKEKRTRNLKLLAEGELDVIVSTLFGEGTNIPSLGFLVRAKAMGVQPASKKPNTEVIQFTGRVIRTHPNKQQPIIIDFYDRGSWKLEEWSKDRIEAYTQYRNFEVQFFDSNGKQYPKDAWKQDTRKLRPVWKTSEELLETYTRKPEPKPESQSEPTTDAELEALADQYG